MAHIEPLTAKQKALIVSNVLKACTDIEKLNGTGYKYLYLCSGFIAHYNLNGFKAYYRRHCLKSDIERNYRQNQWANFALNDEHASYYHSKRDVYNAILGGLVARDELDAMVFMRDHFEVIHIRGASC
jgi:hypothetical protein